MAQRDDSTIPLRLKWELPSLHFALSDATSRPTSELQFLACTSLPLGDYLFQRFVAFSGRKSALQLLQASKSLHQLGKRIQSHASDEHLQAILRNLLRSQVWFDPYPSANSSDKQARSLRDGSSTSMSPNAALGSEDAIVPPIGREAPAPTDLSPDALLAVLDPCNKRLDAKRPPGRGRDRKASIARVDSDDLTEAAIISTAATGAETGHDGNATASAQNTTRSSDDVASVYTKERPVLVGECTQTRLRRLRVAVAGPPNTSRSRTLSAASDTNDRAPNTLTVSPRSAARPSSPSDSPSPSRSPSPSPSATSASTFQEAASSMVDGDKLLLFTATPHDVLSPADTSPPTQTPSRPSENPERSTGLVHIASMSQAHAAPRKLTKEQTLTTTNKADVSTPIKTRPVASATAPLQEPSFFRDGSTAHTARRSYESSVTASESRLRTPSTEAGALPHIAPNSTSDHREAKNGMAKSRAVVALASGSHESATSDTTIDGSPFAVESDPPRAKPDWHQPLPLRPLHGRQGTVPPAVHPISAPQYTPAPVTYHPHAHGVPPLAGSSASPLPSQRNTLQRKERDRSGTDSAQLVPGRAQLGVLPPVTSAQLPLPHGAQGDRTRTTHPKATFSPAPSPSGGPTAAETPSPGSTASSPRFRMIEMMRVFESPEVTDVALQLAKESNASKGRRRHRSARDRELAGVPAMRQWQLPPKVVAVVQRRVDEAILAITNCLCPSEPSTMESHAVATAIPQACSSWTGDGDVIADRRDRSDSAASQTRTRVPRTSLPRVNAFSQSFTDHAGEVVVFGGMHRVHGSMDEAALAKAVQEAVRGMVGAACMVYAAMRHDWWQEFVYSEYFVAYLRLRSMAEAPITSEGIRVTDIIAKGGFGMVFKAEHIPTSVPLAIKRVRKEDNKKHPQLLNCFNERDAIAQLRSVWTIPLIATFQTAQHLCFVMPALEEDLGAVLSRQRTLTDEQAQFYTAQLVLALEVIHDRGYMYRDLKPENVLLDKAGYIRLCDFGLAARGEVAVGRCGTRGYWAPEVVRRTNGYMGTYTQVADWWSLGCVVYEMYVGKCPFRTRAAKNLKPGLTANQSMELATLHLPVDLNRSSIPPLARSLISRLLQRDPMERLGSRGGASEIRRHAFFQGVDWDRLRAKRAPVPPAGPIAIGYIRRKPSSPPISRSASEMWRIGLTEPSPTQLVRGWECHSSKRLQHAYVAHLQNIEATLEAVPSGLPGPTPSWRVLRQPEPIILPALDPPLPQAVPRPIASAGPSLISGTYAPHDPHKTTAAPSPHVPYMIHDRRAGSNDYSPSSTPSRQPDSRTSAEGTRRGDSGFSNNAMPAVSPRHEGGGNGSTLQGCQLTKRFGIPGQPPAHSRRVSAPGRPQYSRPRATSMETPPLLPENQRPAVGDRTGMYVGSGVVLDPCPTQPRLPNQSGRAKSQMIRSGKPTIAHQGSPPRSGRIGTSAATSTSMKLGGGGESDGESAGEVEVKAAGRLRKACCSIC